MGRWGKQKQHENMNLGIRPVPKTNQQKKTNNRIVVVLNREWRLALEDGGRGCVGSCDDEILRFRSDPVHMRDSCCSRLVGQKASNLLTTYSKGSEIQLIT